MSQTIHSNEIRDYLLRAPKRLQFRDGRIVNTTHVRLKWLADIARGDLDTRINRRAGIEDTWKIWGNPVYSACRRHHRNQLRKRGSKYLGN